MTLLDYLASHPLAFVLCAILLGLLVGSFLNVVVHRLPKMMERNWKAEAREALGLEPEPKQATYNLVLPNSACPRCGHEIRPWENIPLVSYLALGGKCSSCKAAIGKRYPLVELATALLSGYVAWHFGFTWQAGAMLLLTWGLLAMSLIDADHQLLPDVLVLPLLWLGLIANHFGLFASLDDALFGAVFGYLSLWSVFWLFKLVTGKEGMGYGDFKLLAMLGAWGGWQILPLTILLSSLVGAILGVIMLRLQRERMQGGLLPSEGEFFKLYGLTEKRLKLAKPEQYVVLPEVISKEPLGPAVRQGDEAWFNIVRWTLYGLLNAEELGVTSSNVERQARDSRNPDVARLLGSEGDAGKDLQLPRDWVVQMVRQVGNYGEIFARNVGDGSPLKMPRGLNAQWNLGGLHYAPPIR
ncbi:hypothetical protein ALP65_01045 [Pseudomonas aeruginosa]|uniref:Prepilin leader peptidase/N-methyltransferase n=3 Tax=Gammaproteobacteria TaxID=1236 RepID=A0A3M5DZA2_PSEAI|nr:hypothetical protein ALP65_01045 [Pseudomonas aeruginosa]